MLPILHLSFLVKRALAYLASVVLLSAASIAQEPTIYTKEILSKVYTVDRIYRSMQGPQGFDKTSLNEELQEAELLWIVGYGSTIVDARNSMSMSQDFMCHANLDIDMRAHRKLFGWDKNASNRLFTLSQGQSFIAFPPGFGIPVSSDEVFSLATQVLNLNIENQTFDVRHKVLINYVKDSELQEPMKPLFMKAANGLVLVDGQDGYYNVETPDAMQHGPGCMVGEAVTGRYREDKFGRKFAGHWVVKPGREVNRTLVTNWMNLPFDTTVHYIAAHLHPFAESLELRDLTADRTVFMSKVRQSAGKIGLEEVQYFSSEEGVALYKDHEYELISTYNNTTDEDQDSMAVMFLYVLDKELMEKGMPQTLTVGSRNQKEGSTNYDSN